MLLYFLYERKRILWELLYQVFIIFFILNKYKLVINFGMHPVFSTVLIIINICFYLYIGLVNNIQRRQQKTK